MPVLVWSLVPDAGEEGLHLHGGVDGPEGAGGQGAPAGGRRPQIHRVGGQHPPWREEPQLVELWLEKKKICFLHKKFKHFEGRKVQEESFRNVPGVLVLESGPKQL